MLSILSVLVSVGLVACEQPSAEASAETEAVEAVTPKEKKRRRAKRAESPRQQQKDAGLEGRWFKAPATLTEQQAQEILELQALGYVSGSTPATSSLGVTQYQADKAAPGVNFYSSGHGPEATLIDMEGKVLHTWSKSFEQAFPGRRLPKKQQGIHHWRRAILLADGGVIAIFEGHGIIRLDKDSELVWVNPTRAHHDAHVLPDGSIYTLTRIAHMIPEVNPDHAVLEDFIIVLDGQTGKERSRVSMLRAFEDSEFRQIWQSSPRRKGDLMHTNAIEVLDGRLAEHNPAFAAGRVMISSRTMDALAVVDLESAKVVWAHTGSYKKQHDPRTLDGGRILFFDNRGAGETSSRIMELDTATGEVEVIYGAEPGQAFTSAFCGTSIRLDNGNTLVTESDQGRAFEFSPAGEIVWELYNPARAGENDEFVASLFEVERFDVAYVRHWLNR
jgi:hypothetical protein